MSEANRRQVLMSGEDVSPGLSETKLNVINIWIAEVKAARKYCVCSKPTMDGTDNWNINKDVYTQPQPASGSGTAVSSDFDLQYFPSGAGASTSAPPKLAAPSRRSRPPCPMCSSQIDEGVTFLSLRDRGEEGLVRKKTSPRSMASIGNLTETEAIDHRHYRAQTARRVKEAVMKPIQKMKSPADNNNKDSKRKRILQPIKKLFKKSGEKSEEGDKGGEEEEEEQEQEENTRPRATEMYKEYRPNATKSKSSLETVASPSDDERRRPRLAIDESAARLRRAQRLLDRSNQEPDQEANQDTNQDRP
ncbi:hypothetical protein F5Y04DRAFT_24278 [Hypomontagnella monticulosa]|nr:hypothetical protein F5Y04DRAFT_24278 [Hypomontagnella monticulosa]